MTERIAVFPGSFDPITVGHIDLIERSLSIFDKVIVAIGINSQKQGYFPVDQRMKWLKELFGGNAQITVASYEGLTVDFCLQHNAKCIIRGVRNAADFDYERTIALLNTSMQSEVETILLPSAPQYSHISSTIVRELIRYKGNFSHLVPDCVTRDAT
ncbi:MAG: phosphopantetheine adenylyltransferase [Sphingobacteriales bacterium BACL12 MAG-120802-bin5]|jgi:pantetheine-phosphate adenylyltransferase|nr:MAG: phosphopantetheine adenylyltransferase [Sphingobacteriales bacterium BACL12 MAG-120802-bin5]